MAAEKEAGAYYLWARGPVREIALSGAAVALESTPAAVVGNHALLINQGGVLQGTFDYGQPEDTSLSLKSSKNEQHRYLIFGVSSLIANTIGIGFGTQQVRYLSEGAGPDAKTSSFSDALVEMNFASAVRLGEHLSLGLGLVRAVAHRDITETANPTVTGSTDEAGNALKIGGLLKLADQVRIGATHRAETNLKGEKQGTRFNGTYIPALTQIGVNWIVIPTKTSTSFPMKLTGGAQLDILTFNELKRELYFSSGIAYQEEDTRLSVVTKYIPRVSLDLEVFKNGPFELNLMGGSYIEPPYFMNSLSRSHVTGGVTLMLWLVSINVATDVAQNYINRNFGIGLANLTF